MTFHHWNESSSMPESSDLFGELLREIRGLRAEVAKLQDVPPPTSHTNGGWFGRLLSEKVIATILGLIIAMAVWMAATDVELNGLSKDTSFNRGRIESLERWRERHTETTGQQGAGP